MVVRKKFNLSLSRKLPDGSLISVTVGTEKEKDTEDSAALFREVWLETMHDLKAAFEGDKYSKSVVKSVDKALAREKKIEGVLSGHSDESAG